ncbi:MAG: hypothetical protein K6C34_00680 [Alphaproteobacteria bacterium]|nr:hypothetical protein [Alphaproteobacteria bacterium]
MTKLKTLQICVLALVCMDSVEASKIEQKTQSDDPASKAIVAPLGDTLMWESESFSYSNRIHFWQTLHTTPTTQAFSVYLRIQKENMDRQLEILARQSEEALKKLEESLKTQPPSTGNHTSYTTEVQKAFNRAEKSIKHAQQAAEELIALLGARIETEAEPKTALAELKEECKRIQELYALHIVPAQFDSMPKQDFMKIGTKKMAQKTYLELVVPNNPQSLHGVICSIPLWLFGGVLDTTFLHQKHNGKEESEKNELIENAKKLILQKLDYDPRPIFEILTATLEEQKKELEELNGFDKLPQDGSRASSSKRMNYFKRLQKSREMPKEGECVFIQQRVQDWKEKTQKSIRDLEAEINRLKRIFPDTGAATVFPPVPRDIVMEDDLLTTGKNAPRQKPTVSEEVTKAQAMEDERRKDTLTRLEQLDPEELLPNMTTEAITIMLADVYEAMGRSIENPLFLDKLEHTSAILRNMDNFDPQCTASELEKRWSRTEDQSIRDALHKGIVRINMPNVHIEPGAELDVYRSLRDPSTARDTLDRILHRNTPNRAQVLEQWETFSQLVMGLLERHLPSEEFSSRPKEERPKAQEKLEKTEDPESQEKIQEEGEAVPIPISFDDGANVYVNIVDKITAQEQFITLVTGESGLSEETLKRTLIGERLQNRIDDLKATIWDEVNKGHIDKQDICTALQRRITQRTEELGKLSKANADRKKELQDSIDTLVQEGATLFPRDEFFTSLKTKRISESFLQPILQQSSRKQGKNQRGNKRQGKGKNRR